MAVCANCFLADLFCHRPVLLRICFVADLVCCIHSAQIYSGVFALDSQPLIALRSRSEIYY
jgi:hypothetical protein